MHLLPCAPSGGCPSQRFYWWAVLHGTVPQRTSCRSTINAACHGRVHRLPGIRPFLLNMTGIDPDASPVDPDLAVGLGAAIQAGMLEGSVDRLMVFDVWQACVVTAY